MRVEMGIQSPGCLMGEERGDEVARQPGTPGIGPANPGSGKALEVFQGGFARSDMGIANTGASMIT